MEETKEELRKQNALLAAAVVALAECGCSSSIVEVKAEHAPAIEIARRIVGQDESAEDRSEFYKHSYTGGKND